ncbi:phage tail sheath subtilisin-like domain-containing protein [bacterium]|nr:phage tail sheath subtilisin-like domain-containing protein [bacterium]
MAFQVSAGVLVQEKDLTRIIPAVSTSIGAVAIQATKGPLDEVTSISSEQELVSTFGKPNSTTFEGFFTAANFLAYSNSLRVVRVQNSSVANASQSGSTSFVIKNTQDYQDNYAAGQGSVGLWAARTAGAFGNSLRIDSCPSATAYEEAAKTTVNDASTAVGDTVVTVTAGTGISAGDIVNFGDNFEYRVVSISTNNLNIVRKDEPQYFGTSDSSGLHAAITDGAAVRRRWRHYDLFDKAPGTSPFVQANGGTGDEIHVVVVDEDGQITGTKGDVLETFGAVSKASDAKTAQGSNNYYPDVIYNQSNYIYWMDHNAGGSNWGTAASGLTFTNVTAVSEVSLANGNDGTVATTAQKLTAYTKFADAETVEVSLIMAGNGDATHIDNLITIAENRKDAVVFASPERSDVVNIADDNTQKTNVVSFFNGIRSTSYAVFDSGYKYTYDRYNDLYRYVPLNGDIAGLTARTDLIADSWFSPAGLNRGIVRGAVKLAFNPSKTQRDELYRARVNPVATFPGQGTVLFGDKTGLTAPSAFDRINVRRLFITLEKAIATASKFQLFEFNDEFTRANFRNIVEPFLREVQGRRGITDFLVVCDETNNTGEVIDRNEFIAEIFIKPARSINFITLQFIATRTGVSFDEVAGG